MVEKAVQWFEIICSRWSAHKSVIIYLPNWPLNVFMVFRSPVIVLLKSHFNEFQAVFGYKTSVIMPTLPNFASNNAFFRVYL